MSRKIFFILFFLSIGYRFIHFGEEIDSPHTWRQSDTANYVWDYYENGIDLGKPSVCWMGDHKTVILEFPIVEAIIASFYHIITPSHITARIILLLFFIGSCWFLYQIISFFLDKNVAKVGTIIYSLMPLTLFYSRAIHIDFAEMFFVLGMVYFYLLGIQKEKLFLLLIGSIFCTLAFMVKAPYVVPFTFPLIWFIVTRKKMFYVFKSFYLFIIPIILFFIWQNHVFEVNSAAPDWDFIPGYRKFTFNAGWYFGGIDQRINIENWVILKNRIYNEVLGLLGIVLFFFNIFFLKKKHLFFIFWLIGCIIYLLIFFNLNRVHNYYQIPFTAILAVFIACTIVKITRHYSDQLKNGLIVVLLLLFGFENIKYAEKNYYNIQKLHIQIGSTIKKQTEPHDLVIINFENIDSKCPNFHYAAKRNGWVIPEWGLKGEIIYKLMLEGATYFATARKNNLSEEMISFLTKFPSKNYQLIEGYSLILFETNFKYLWDDIPEEEKAKLISKGFNY